MAEEMVFAELYALIAKINNLSMNSLAKPKFELVIDDITSL